MSEKNINNVRIVNKHDIEENWLKATGFIPKQGELIVYDVDNTHSYERVKIGDGIQNVNDLPFVDGAVRESLVEQINNATKDAITVEGGGALTLTDIFGEPPYTIEITPEEDNFSAFDIDYDGSNSGLSATNVQGAIDELRSLTKTAATDTDYSTYRVRNTAILSAAPETMSNGNIAFVYS